MYALPCLFYNTYFCLGFIGGSKVSGKSENVVNTVAKLLQVEAAGLKQALTTRLMSQVKQRGAMKAGDIK